MKDLRKSIERKKEVSREILRFYRENLKSRRLNDEESGEILERLFFFLRMVEKRKKLMTYEKSCLEFSKKESLFLFY